MICIEVAHSLPYRLRLRFKPALQMHQAFGIQTELSSAYPDLPLRLWGLGQGLIIGNGTYPLDPNLVSDIAKLINNPVDHVPSWRHRMIHALMILAILGWALPVLPGTPFFLIALALRPKRP